MNKQLQPQPPRRKLVLHDLSSRELVALVLKFLRERRDGLESGLDEWDHPTWPEPDNPSASADGLQAARGQPPPVNANP